MKRFSIALAVLCAGLFGAPAARAVDDPLSGAWTVRGKVSAFAFVLTCRFERRGEALGGVCYDAGTNKAHPLTQGAVAGSKVAWTYRSSFMFKPFDAAYVGALAADGIRGSLIVPGYSGQFTAVRAP
jgi:hypothetical protein